MKLISYSIIFILIAASLGLKADDLPNLNCRNRLDEVSVAKFLRDLSPELKAKLDPKLLKEIKKGTRLEGGLVYILFGQSTVNPRGINKRRFNAGVKKVKEYLSVFDDEGKRPTHNYVNDIGTGVVIATGSVENILAILDIQDVSGITWSPSPLFGH